MALAACQVSCLPISVFVATQLVSCACVGDVMPEHTPLTHVQRNWRGSAAPITISNPHHPLLHSSQPTQLAIIEDRSQ